MLCKKSYRGSKRGLQMHCKDLPAQILEKMRTSRDAPDGASLLRSHSWRYQLSAVTVSCATAAKLCDIICDRLQIDDLRAAFHDTNTRPLNSMNRRQTFAAAEGSSIPIPATAPRQANRQSLAPGKVTRPSSSQSSQQLASSQQSQQGSQGYHAPATVARGGSTYGATSVPLGWSGARGDAGNLRSSYAPATA